MIMQELVGGFFFLSFCWLGRTGAGWVDGFVGHGQQGDDGGCGVTILWSFLELLIFFSSCSFLFLFVSCLAFGFQRIEKIGFSVAVWKISRFGLGQSTSMGERKRLCLRRLSVVCITRRLFDLEKMHCWSGCAYVFTVHFHSS